MLVTGATGSAAATNSSINYDAGPNPGVEENYVEIATHDRAEMSSPLEYYNDDGDLTELPAHLNTSKDEQVSLRFDKINDSVLTEFPRKDAESGDNSASATDGSEWTVGGPQSGELTVSDTTPHTGVEAVKIATGGSFASGDEAHATYSNFSITDDPTKRVILLIGNVETLDSGATVTFNFTSTDGDEVVVTLDSAATAGDKDVFATSTGNGYVLQERVNNLSVSGSGDGTIEDLQELNVTVTGGDATVVLTGIGAERKSKLDLGTHYYDGDDSDTDEEEHTDVEDISGAEQSGYVGLTSLDTLDPVFDDAKINDLRTHGVVYSASDQDSDVVSVEYADAAPNYPSFDQTVEVFYRIEVPQAIDLTHNGLSLTAEQKFVGSRYADVEYAEDPSEDFTEVDSWTDLSSTYSEQDETHELDATVSAGTPYEFHAVIKLTSDDVAQLQDTGGAAGGPVSSSGGPVDFLLGLPGLLIGMVAAFGGRLAKLWKFPWVV